MIIRQAIPGDEDKAAPVVLEFYTAYVESLGLTFNAASARRLMGFFTGDLPGGVAFVAEDGDRILGFIAGVIMPWSLDLGKLIFEELAWFMSKSARNGPAGVRLYKRMEAHCIEKGVKAMTMGSFVASNGAVGTFYQRQGYSEVERKWIKQF